MSDDDAIRDGYDRLATRYADELAYDGAEHASRRCDVLAQRPR